MSNLVLFLRFVRMPGYKLLKTDYKLSTSYTLNEWNIRRMLEQKGSRDEKWTRRILREFLLRLSAIELNRMAYN